MSVKTTPEKVKNLLSSFLATPKQPLKAIPKIPSKDSPVSDSVQINSSPATDATSNLRSYEAFLERLDSFSSLTWFGKPKELSPLICARYGWTNVDSDSLQCVSCKVYLCGKLPPQTDAKAYQTFKEKLKKDILAAHDKFCVLAANPCPEHFCQIACDNPVSLTSDFSQRIMCLNAIPNSRLPSIDYSTLHSYDYDEGQGAAYCQRNLLPNLDASPEIVSLTVTGWTCTPSKRDILMCTKCRREIGLWNFNTESGPSADTDGDKQETGNSEQEPETKIPKLVAKSSFNPVEEHKNWCPWLLPTSSSSPGSSTTTTTTPTTVIVGGKRVRGEDRMLPALIVALKAMAPGLMDNNTGLAQTMKVSPVADGLRCIRRVMRGWSSKNCPSVSPVTPPTGSSSS